MKNKHKVWFWLGDTQDVQSWEFDTEEKLNGFIRGFDTAMGLIEYEDYTQFNSQEEVDEFLRENFLRENS